MIKILNSQLSDEIVTEIGKFSILWAEFEKTLGNKCSDELLLEQKNNVLIKDEILIKFNSSLHGRIEYFDEDVEAYTNYNLIPENAHRPRDKYIKLMKDFLNLDEFVEKDWICGALLCIYRIRNNLLHGLKYIDELNGQLELFKSMNKVLENIRINER